MEVTQAYKGKKENGKRMENGYQNAGEGGGNSPYVVEYGRVTTIYKTT